jgi:hypothetical protein
MNPIKLRPSGMSIGVGIRWPARRSLNGPTWPINPLHAAALEIGSSEIQKRILAKRIGVALAQLGDLDDAQGEQFSRRVLAAVGSKENPALLDGLPCPIEGVNSKFSPGQRRFYSTGRHPMAEPSIAADVSGRFDHILVGAYKGTNRLLRAAC